MTVFRAILPNWAVEQNPSLPRVVEGQFTEDKLLELNSKFYNIYYLPNYPSIYDPSKKVDGSQIDKFEWVFVDMDLKDGYWNSKQDFIEYVKNQEPIPTKIVDSGNGVHVYWKVQSLDA